MTVRFRFAIVSLLVLLAVSGRLDAAVPAPIQALTDARMEGQLWSVFVLNKHLAAFEIDIDVQGNEAALDGVVDRAVQRDLAAALALGVAGIDEVDNQIGIAEDESAEGSGSTEERDLGDRVTDATTTAAIKSKLLWNRNTDGLDIDVTTHNGVVTLEGIADSDISRDLAEQLAANTDDVESVDNRLEVDEPAAADPEVVAGTAESGGESVSDIWIMTKIRSTLLLSTDVPGTTISIHVDEGYVELGGSVETEAERSRAIALAADVRGVVEVASGDLQVENAEASERD